MDAIVIACANRNIVNYLNNESASRKAKISRHDLQAILCDKVRTDDKGNYQWRVKSHGIHLHRMYMLHWKI